MTRDDKDAPRCSLSFCAFGDTMATTVTSAFYDYTTAFWGRLIATATLMLAATVHHWCFCRITNSCCRAATADLCELALLKVDFQPSLSLRPGDCRLQYVTCVFKGSIQDTNHSPQRHSAVFCSYSSLLFTASTIIVGPVSVCKHDFYNITSALQDQYTGCFQKSSPPNFLEYFHFV